MLDNLVRTLTGIRVGGTKNQNGLDRLDRGVITIALLVAALDGTVQDSEFRAVQNLASKCRGVTAKNLRALLDDVIGSVGGLIAMSQIGVYNEKDRLAYFLKAAKKALPHGFADGSLADLRRAFALWIGIGVADGEFSVFERVALMRLARQCAFIRKHPLLESGFFSKAERIMTDLADPRKREKAAADLEQLVAKVEVTDARGRTARRSSASIAVKLALLGTLCLAGVGTSEAASSMLNTKIYDANIRQMKNNQVAGGQQRSWRNGVAIDDDEEENGEFESGIKIGNRYGFYIYDLMRQFFGY